MHLLSTQLNLHNNGEVYHDAGELELGRSSGSVASRLTSSLLAAVRQHRYCVHHDWQLCKHGVHSWNYSGITNNDRLLPSSISVASRLKGIASIQFWHQRLAILCCKLPRQSYKFAAPSMTSQTKRRHHDVIPHAVVDNFTKILKSHDKSHQITTYSRWHANFLRLFDDIRCKQCWQKFLGKSSRNFLHN